MRISMIRFAWPLVASAAVAISRPALGAEELREEIHKTFPLAAEGTARLENVNGDIHILVWDREEAKLDAIKKGKTQEALDEAKIEIDTKPDWLRVKTEDPKSENSKRKDRASVEYTLTVPKRARLEHISAVNGSVSVENALGDVNLSSVNGSIRASGLAGQADLSSVNGSVKAAFASFSKPVTARSVNGSVTVALPSDANGEILASTVNGGIHNDFPGDHTSSSRSPHHLKDRIGQGGPKIKLGTVNGGIRVERSGGGAETSR